jgi:Zn-dependent M28 family amino/carboxypeptidase
MESTAAYLHRIVTVLARDIGVRSYRDLGRLNGTANYITEQFASLGYAVVRQPFLYRGNTYVNLIAEQAGASSPETALIVGAHYDTVRSTPGADDNASGVAGLLGLARALAGERPDRTVRFVAFCLEEPPAYRTKNMGSYHYALSLKENHEQVEGMICLEMIGFFRDQKGSQQYPFPLMNRRYPDAGNFIALVGNLRSRAFTRSIADGFRKSVSLPVVTLNAPAIVVGIDFSDHWSFNKLGYKALMATDTAFYRNPHYHSPTDLPETLDYERMSSVVNGLAATMRERRGERDGGREDGSPS